MCFIEGTNLSEGRGTTKPFELIGAPFLNAHQFAAELNGLKLPGVKFRPAFFTPMFSKYEGEFCRGIQAHILDRNLLKPIEVGLGIISMALRLYPQDFQWRSSFDLLAGSDQIRQKLSAGIDVGELVNSWEAELSVFMEKRLSSLIY